MKNFTNFTAILWLFDFLLRAPSFGKAHYKQLPYHRRSVWVFSCWTMAFLSHTRFTILGNATQCYNVTIQRISFFLQLHYKIVREFRVTRPLIKKWKLPYSVYWMFIFVVFWFLSPVLGQNDVFSWLKSSPSNV